MNTATASLSVKSLKPVLTLVKKHVGRSLRDDIRNVHIACNGSAVIRWNNTEFRIQTSVPCEHTGDDFAFQYDFGDLFGMIGKTKAKEFQIDSAGSITVGPITKDIEAPTAWERVAVDEKGKSDTAHVCYLVPQARSFPDYVEVFATELRAALLALLHCTDKEITRYALGGILLTVAGDSLECVATDSHRLGIRSVDILQRSGTQALENAVIPHSAAELFLALLPKKLPAGDIVRISFRTDEKTPTITRLTLEHGATRVDMPLVAGRFPRYRDVIPQGCKTVGIPREELLALLQEFLPHLTPESRGIDFKLSRGLLTLRHDGISVCLEIPRENAWVKCTLDGRYLVDALSVCLADYVTWGFIDGESAMQFYDSDHQEIVMPLTRDR